MMQEEGCEAMFVSIPPGWWRNKIYWGWLSTAVFAKNHHRKEIISFVYVQCRTDHGDLRYSCVFPDVS